MGSNMTNGYSWGVFCGIYNAVEWEIVTKTHPTYDFICGFASKNRGFRRCLLGIFKAWDRAGFPIFLGIRPCYLSVSKTLPVDGPKMAYFFHIRSTRKTPFRDD
jgi:hypothetical protein